MKFVLVTINLDTTPGRTPMVYPKGYNANEVDRNSTGPHVRDGGCGRGEPTEELLLYLNDATADKYNQDPRMRIITNVEADTWLSVCKKLENVPEERVTDEKRMLAIIAKNGAGIPLSDEDQAALDPDNKTPGIIRTRKNIADMYDVS